ncbi:MAG: hypothetical protein ACFCUG_05315 [Thiotrichales bacterium]
MQIFDQHIAATRGVAEHGADFAERGQVDTAAFGLTAFTAWGGLYNCVHGRGRLSLLGCWRPDRFDHGDQPSSNSRFDPPSHGRAAISAASRTESAEGYYNQP